MIDAMDLLYNRYERAVMSLRQLENEMRGAKQTMQTLRETGDMASLSHVRMNADMIARSIEITQRDIEHCEHNISNQFFDYRPVRAETNDECGRFSY